MPFKSDCPNCGVSYEVAEERVGLTTVCEKCGSSFQLIPESQVEESSGDSTSLFSSVPPRNDDLPSTIGRYKIIQKLGQGGMGVVYLADDTVLRRRVALKVPLRDFIRFLREASVAAQFHHANFCPIHDIGEYNGVPFLVMAFIEGKTLAGLLVREKPWEPRKAVELIRTLAIALAEAHRKGVIHRDLKPANIMVDEGGKLFLMDFGLARQTDSVDPVSTADGTVLGTATYMPPEQAEGRVKEVGPLADLYSLGVILYELLTGRPPFEGTLAWKVLAQVVTADPPKPSRHNPSIDATLEAIILTSIAKKPEDRFASMDDFARVLQGWLDGLRSNLVEKKLVAKIRSTAPRIPQSQELLTNSIGMKLKFIPDGAFLMGAPDGEPKAEADEKPQHLVRITRPFYLGVYEVTQAEYQAVMGTNPSYFSVGGKGKDKVAGMDTARFPVENVSWLDAAAFCNKLSEREGLQPCFGPKLKEIAEGTGYRLPTEAEWEYACRARTKSAFAFGDQLSATEANFNGNHTYNGSEPGPYLDRPAPVGSYRPNAFGLFDMHGNVWQWCSDWYDGEYYKKSPECDPPGPTHASYRVSRGGSWIYDPLSCRSAFRFKCTPDSRYFSLGFRVARVLLG